MSIRWEISRGTQPVGAGWEPFAVTAEEIWWRRALDPPSEPGRLLTARELAHFLRIDVATLRRHVNAGGIPKPIRLGRGHRWHMADVLAHLRR